MKHYLLLLLVSILLLQCSNKQDNTQQAAADGLKQTAAVTSYPSITSERMRFLWDNCDYVDFIFYTTNFSMSQNDQNAIRSTLSGVSITPAQIDPSCKPVGRVFFQVDGRNQEEADLFFGGNCLYYIFLENGTYAYANQLTEQGLNFYQKIFEQVSTQSTGGQ